MLEFIQLDIRPTTKINHRHHYHHDSSSQSVVRVISIIFRTTKVNIIVNGNVFEMLPEDIA